MSHEAAHIKEERIKRHEQLMEAADHLAWVLDEEDWKEDCDCGPVYRCPKCRAITRIKEALKKYDVVRNELWDNVSKERLKAKERKENR